MMPCFGHLNFLLFEFVSSLDIRISDLFPVYTQIIANIDKILSILRH